MKVKMLAVLALVLLVSSASEGRILSKCELKSQLQAALGGNQGGNVTGAVTNGPGNVTTSVPVDATAVVPENVTSSVPGNVTVPGNATANLTLIAQIVCTVERVSKFNTGLVTTIREDSRPPVRPPVRPPLRPPQQPNVRPGGRPGRPGGRPRGKRSHVAAQLGRPARLSDDSSESSESSEENSRERPGLTTKLLGIFQLSDRVACDSGSGQSLNICRMKCSALIDDDIRDDIACLKTLLDMASIVSSFASLPQNKPRFILSLNECRNVNPAQYFAECP
ncbi:uncharacterized protein LOC109049049 [Cyprinus carpio]|uniref:Uncharacterized protein LOC109049049 n=1 Tax=Cyprinus carpio TaxID=7962 RepID=A0A9Q9UY87_CYPCA|nr:uncharacterized protein LOC109049049 [Cyprinus carpio]XP_042619188.1 uncharacterized protein LOC109049049 [Cyprinus carpio]